MTMDDVIDVSDLRPAGLPGPVREPAIVYSNYSRIGEHIRQVTPNELQCSVLCGGRRCKYDSSESWKPEQMAIDGIFSHWVTDNILAMARPNKDVIGKKKIIEQFLSNNIKTIINLQLPGEHSSCGFPLTEGGFSYEPNVFMENGIFYYNFGLKDHGEPTLTGVLDMVKVMAFSLSEGKVAVHCHAGLGRTGVLITCYLVYALRVRANDAIRYVRLKRPNAVQTSGQISIVQEFEAFILPQHYVFCNREFLKEKRNPEFTLHQFLNRQRAVLHGYEARTLKDIPKIIYVICERLLKLCGCSGSNPSPHMLSPLEINYDIGTPSFTSFFVSAQFDQENGKISYSAPQSLGSPALSASLNSARADSLRQHSEEDSGYTVNEGESYGDLSTPASAQFQSRRLNQNCITPDVPSCISDPPEHSIDSLLDDGIHNQKLSDNRCFQELNSQVDLRKMANEERIKVVPPKKVYESLIMDHSVLDQEIRRKIRNYRIELNIRQSAWERLNTESDLAVLTGLLFIWMEHLRQAIFHTDSLSYMVLSAHKPENCLRKMDKETRYTLEYIMRFIARLQPFTRAMHDDLIRRIVASLTQQAVPVKGTLLPTGRGFSKLREGTLRKVLEFMTKFFDLVYMESRIGSATCTPSISSSAIVDNSARVTPPGQVQTPPPPEHADKENGEQ